MQTFSKKCQEELSKELNIIYPWSCKNKILKTVQYDGLLTDIKTYWNEQPRYREGFEMTDEQIIIPTFFTKINGIYNKRKKQKQLEKFFKLNSFYYKSIEKFQNTIFKANDLDYNRINKESINLLLSKKNINYYDLEAFNKKELKEYLFFELSPFMRKQCLEKLKIFEEKYKSVFDTKMQEFYLHLIFLDKKYIDCLNSFDYPFHNPKIVIKEEINRNFREIDVMILLYLNLIGFDILILNPYRKTDLNIYIDMNEIYLEKFKNEKKIDNDNMLLISSIILTICSLILFLPNIDYFFKIIFLIGLFILQLFICFPKNFLNCFDDKKNSKITMFFNVLGIMICFIIFLMFISYLQKPYLSKDGELNVEKEVLINEESDFYFEIGKEAYLDELTGELLLYLGNPPTNDQKVFIDIFYKKQMLLEEELEEFSYYTLLRTNSELKVGSYDFTIKISTYSNPFTNPLSNKELQIKKDIKVECISHENFQKIMKK